MTKEKHGILKICQSINSYNVKIFKCRSKGSLPKLKLILEMRKLKQKNQSITVKKIINNVKKYGDKAVIRYEKILKSKI